MEEVKQDIFISHAGSDKERYIAPLAECLTKRQVTFWLDNIEVHWGDSIPLLINDGLRTSRHVLLCLSKAFLGRPWPEAELASTFAAQTTHGTRRLLPLILNSREQVLEHYPLLAPLMYKEYTDPPDLIAEDIAKIVRPAEPQDKKDSRLHVIVESVHSGKLCNVYVSPRASIRWLADQAQKGLGVSESADIGAPVAFRVRWFLVDANAERVWRHLSRWEQWPVHAVVQTAKGPRVIADDHDRLEAIGVQEGTVFHLYAIEDERYDLPCASAG